MVQAERATICRTTDLSISFLPAEEHDLDKD